MQCGSEVMPSKQVPILLAAMALLVSFQCCTHVCVCETEPVGEGRVAVSATGGQQVEDDDDDLLMEVEVEEDEEMDIFEPTHEWKTVEDGQVIPPGLHVRMNMETGKREAKLMSEETEQPTAPSGKARAKEESDDSRDSTATGQDAGPAEKPAAKKPDERKPEKKAKTKDSFQKGSSFQFPGDQRRAHYYGHSDRRGIINKRRRPFLQSEVAEMFKRMEEDTVDFSKLPGITRSHVIPENVKIDERVKRELSKSKASHGDVEGLVQGTLHRELAKMMQHSRTLARQTASISELLHALEELEYHVHHIDNAKELNSIGGLVLVVRLLNHSHPDIRSNAAHVVGAATQSNPHVQSEVLDYGAMELLCQFIAAEEPDLVQRRGLFALSALMRGKTHPQLTFLEQCHGLSQLGKDFHERSPLTQLKAVTLLTDLLHEQRELLHDSNQLSSLLHKHIQEHSWCQHVPALLHKEAPTPIEKALQAMNVLQHLCDFTSHSSRLQELSQQFEKALGEGEGEDEVAKTLLQHSQELLKNIRQRNKEL